MNSKIVIAIAGLAVLALLPSPQAVAQCTPENITIDWTLIKDIDGGIDIAWDIIPIDDDDQDTNKDDGYIVVGETYKDDSLKRQALVMRLNADGSTNAPGWISIYGQNQNDVAYSVKQASNGRLIICGCTKSNKIGGKNTNNVWFFEYDLEGNLVEGSEHEYGGTGIDNGYDIIEDPNTGNYVIAGGCGVEANYDLSSHAGTGINAGGEYWVLAIDPNTYEIVWENIYHGLYTNGVGKDFARGIMVDHEGNYLVTGYCTSCGPDKTQMQAGVIKMTNTGETIWLSQYGDLSENNNIRDQGSHSIILAYDESNSSYSYLFTGVSHPQQCFDGNNHDIYAFRLTPEGENLWNGGCGVDEGVGYGGKKKDDGLKAVQTSDGGFLIAGDTYSQTGDDYVGCNHTGEDTADVWLVKLDKDGAVEWDESIGDVYFDLAYSIKETHDGSYVVAGEFGSSPTNQDLYVFKFSLGTSTGECNAPTGLNAQVTGCEVTLTWDVDPQVEGYLLRYKETSSSEFTTIFPATSPYVVEGGPGGSNKYKWGVQAKCAGNVSSEPAQGPGFQTQGCKMGADEAVQGGALSIFPNPSDGTFEVFFEQPNAGSEKVRVEVLDQVGRVMSYFETSTIDGFLNQQLSVSELPSGFYWVRIQADGKAYQTKLVLQK